MEAKDNNGWTPLIWASAKGHLDTVTYLVKECGANVEAKDSAGNTPLIIASLQGHLDTVTYLVEECGANVEAKGNNGLTALALAKKNGKSDVEQYLRSKGAREKLLSVAQRKKKVDEQLNEAALNGDTAKALKLVEQGGDVDWENPNAVSEWVRE